MQLIIDIGNTLIKYYVFEGESIIESCSEKHCNWHQSLDRILKVYPKLKAVIVSDVRGTILKELQEALKTLPVVLCSFDLKLPFTTKYTPSQQLGQDRIALLAAC